MRRLLATALSLAVVLIAAPAAGGHAKLRGTFQTLPAGAALGLHIEGTAKLKLTGEGTVVKVVVRGLAPEKTYAAHLHSAPCSDPTSPGGGHYKNDPNGPSEPPNELWLSSTDNPTDGITTDDDGVASGRGSADWVPRPKTPLSVVIHNIAEGGTTAGGDKIACADLGAAPASDGRGDSGDRQNQDDD